MFEVNQKVVYPGHGVARVTSIVTQTISGTELTMYELEFFATKMKVMVPLNHAQASGMRPICSHAQVAHTLTFVAARPIDEIPAQYTAAYWNKKSREYKEIIDKGDFNTVFGLYCDLFLISSVKRLSARERTMLTRIESMLVEEFAIVEKISPEEALTTLRSALGPIDTITL